MARKLVTVTADFKVYYDREWGEYQVEPKYGSINEKRAQTYHTEDKQDAIDTCHHMQRLKDQGITDAKDLAMNKRQSTKGY